MKEPDSQGLCRAAPAGGNLFALHFDLGESPIKPLLPGDIHLDPIEVILDLVGRG